MSGLIRSFFGEVGEVVLKEKIAILAFNSDQFGRVIPPIASGDDFARAVVTLGFNSVQIWDKSTGNKF